MIDLKIGRNVYKITDKDEFMDNGACVQLLSQSRERDDWGRKKTPVLSKRAAKEISKYLRVHKGTRGSAEIFSIDVL